MRRLYSTFAAGLPGLGLVLLRLAAGTACWFHDIAELTIEFRAALLVFKAAAAMLLIAGLWTPIAGALVAIIELGSLFWLRSSIWTPVLLAAVGIALALLGPGAWSLDARLFGWRRVEIPDQ